jgi:hypothetical protein
MCAAGTYVELNESCIADALFIHNMWYIPARSLGQDDIHVHAARYGEKRIRPSLARWLSCQPGPSLARAGLRPLGEPTVKSALLLTRVHRSTRSLEPRTLAPHRLFPPLRTPPSIVVAFTSRPGLSFRPVLTEVDPLLLSLTLALSIFVSPSLSISICLSPHRLVARFARELLLVPQSALVTRLVGGSGAPNAHG